MAGTDHSIEGTTFEGRAGWDYTTELMDYGFDSMADAILRRWQYNIEKAGVLSGFTLEANPGSINDLIGIDTGVAMDRYGQLIYETTAQTIAAGAADVDKYVCVWYNETTGGPDESYVMGTVANMYTIAHPEYSLEENPTVGVRIKLGKITDYAGGIITLSQTVGVSGDRDELALRNPWQSIDIDDVKSSSVTGVMVAGVGAGSYETNMLSIPYTREDLRDELNYIKSVLAERWTNGDRYEGAWDDVTAAMGTPNTPSAVSAVTDLMANLQYNDLEDEVGGGGPIVAKPLNTLAYITVSWTGATEPPNVERYQIKIVPVQKIGGVDTEITARATSYFTTDSGITFTIQNVQVGVKFNIYVRAISVMGWAGAWATSTSIITSRTAAAPNPSGPLTITQVQGGFKVEWPRIPTAEGYRILAKEASIPTESSNDVAVNVDPNRTSEIVILPYTQQQVYFRLYSLNGAGEISSSFIESNNKMTKAAGDFTEEEVERLKKFKNDPTKDIDMTVMEDIASWDFTKSGKSTGTPTVLKIKLPIKWRISETINFSTGDLYILDSFTNNDNWSIVDASFWQRGASGDCSGITLKIGRSGVDWVEIPLADSTAVDVKSGTLCVPSSEDLPSTVFPSGGTLQVALESAVTPGDVVNLYGYLKVMYELE